VVKGKLELERDGHKKVLATKTNLAKNIDVSVGFGLFQHWRAAPAAAATTATTTTGFFGSEAPCDVLQHGPVAESRPLALPWVFPSHYELVAALPARFTIER